MKTFLEEVVADIIARKMVSDELVLIVPSKRAGLFLLQLFAKNTSKASFAPTILTIEEFVVQLSGLRYASNTQLLFELYEVYRNLPGIEIENFQGFSKWGNTLLQDFNEIDRYLVSPRELFSYLSAVQETNQWSTKTETTPMIESYLKFWRSLEPLYHRFTEHLLLRNIGYQGLVYRRANSCIGDYSEKAAPGSHFFIGFNALNAAESNIIQTMLGLKKAEAFWDIDPCFLEDPIHDAGFFIRNYLRTWPYFSNHSLQGPQKNYDNGKNIQIVGVPKNVSQAKYVGSILDRFTADGSVKLNNTAIILGDENLLNPLINALPPTLSQINITMGFPLAHTPVASLFNEFISLYVNSQKKGWYYNDILSFVSHPFVKTLCRKPDTTLSDLSNLIREKNWVYIDAGLLQKLLEPQSEVLGRLFSRHYHTPVALLNASITLINALKDPLESEGDAIGLEYLSKMLAVFNEIKTYMGKYDFITDIKSFQSLFRELVSRETLDFYGKPLEGVQIMGMLESRNLDFETVIITSVNEGILPSGKTSSSFIPFDIKREFNLPTYKEKDAVYTYHFYRLLQRAKNIVVLYNTEPDVLEGGEKSRFITQLLTEERKQGTIRHSVASPAVDLPFLETQVIGKEPSILQTLKERAEKGFSPSSLASYIRNPLEFYKKYILGIQESIEVEENIAANTFGTVLHESMEVLYQPFLGSRLQPRKIKERIADIPDIVRGAFAKHYPNVELQSGKNLIAFNVILRYLEKYLILEADDCEKHEIILLALEESLRTPVEVPGLPFPVFLKGTIDRVDQRDGVVRILDYKTGNTKASELEITDWETIIIETDKSKAFQIMCYALMYSTQHPVDTFLAGIVPIRDLEAGNLMFRTRQAGSRSPENTLVSRDTLDNFLGQLQILLQTICDPEEAFVAKED